MGLLSFLGNFYLYNNNEYFHSNVLVARQRAGGIVDGPLGQRITLVRTPIVDSEYLIPHSEQCDLNGRLMKNDGTARKSVQRGCAIPGHVLGPPVEDVLTKGVRPINVHPR